LRTQIEQLHRTPRVIGSLSKANRTAPQWQLPRYVRVAAVIRVDRNAVAPGRPSAGEVGGEEDRVAVGSARWYVRDMTVAVLGTGQMGTALARALARANVPLAIGSRDRARAEAQAARLASELPGRVAVAAGYAGAVRAADVVVLAIDFDDARKLLPTLSAAVAGKIVVDPTTPWGAPLPSPSGAAELASLLPPRTPIVAAWKTTFAAELALAPRDASHDVLLCGDDAAAKATIAGLVRATGFRPLDCGGLEHAGTLEGLTRMMGPILRNLGLPKETVPALRLAALSPRG
jgi:NADPH-dependent F420 reductase